MFPGGRSSQNMPGGDSRHPSSYYRDVAAVSNPAWFGNNPAPVPPPAQYPSRAESGRDLLAESYERMRNEMRSLQGSSTSKYGSGAAAPPPPKVEEKANPLTQLLENKDVSLSSLLEAAMDPSIGSSKRTEDPIMKKTILDKCEEKIAQLYRLRINGQGMFFPMTQPKAVKFDGVSTLTHNHPRIEFNMVSEDPVWTCPDVVIETKKEEPPVEKKDEDEEKDKDSEDKANEKGRNPSNTLDKIEVLEPRGREPKGTAPAQPQPLQPQPQPLRQQPQMLLLQHQKQQQEQQQLLLHEQLKSVTQRPPPVVANVSYPALSQYRTAIPALMDTVTFSQPPPVIPNSEKLPMEVWAEIEKERRRKEIEIEWDRLMQDKERKEKKRKRKKRSHSRSRSSSGSRSRRSKSRRSKSRYRSRSRGRSSHRRSHSRHRSRGRSRDKRYRRKSRSLSLSPSPPHKKTKSPLRILQHRRSPSPRWHHRRSPSPRGHRERSSSFLRSLQRELARSPPRLLHSPPRYRYSPPPRPREEYTGAPIQPYSDPQHGPPPPHGPHSGSGPPPGYDNYYDYGSGPYPPPPGMDSYGPPGIPPQGPYGPQGPGPGPWMDPGFGPPMRGPGPWMGPGPAPRWFGPRPPMGPQGPMPPQMQRPPIGPRQMQRPPGPRGPAAVPAKPPTVSAKTPSVPAKTPTQNLIDLTSEEKTANQAPAEKTPVAVVDITDDDKPVSDSAKAGIQRVASRPLSENSLPTDDEPKEAEKTKQAEREAEKLVLRKAKVITNLAPPGVSPERETHTKYPNVESEFTRPMRAQFRKMLEPLEKVLDKIRLYQRDSFDYKTLIKSLEAGKIEFMGVHTLHDGLLCKLEINRKQPDKFFKLIIPYTHVGRVLRAIHSTYHDYSIGRIQRLVDDLFFDPHDFPLSKIISVVKQCKECIEQEEKDRERLRKKEILILDSPEPVEEDVDQPLSDDRIDDPMVKPRRDRHRLRTPEREERKRPKDERSRRPSAAERVGKSRRDSEKDKTEKSRNVVNESKTKSLRKSVDEEAETYSKFEDLGVSRKADELKSSGGENSKQEKGDATKNVQSGIGRNHKDDEAEEKDGEGSKNGKKVPASADKVGPKNKVEAPSGKSKDGKKEGAALNQKKPISMDKNTQKTTVAKKQPDSNQSKSANKTEQQSHPTPEPAQPKTQPKPTVNPDDFKERVRTVQMGVDPLGSQIADLEGLGKKSSDPALLIKAGMLCRRLPSPKGGKPEVKIVVTPACLKQMVEIVHTMAALHAPFQKTVTVFIKHFVPIDGLEEAVTEVLNSCAKCSSEVKN